ncbi:MAG: ribosomal RNA small subunit methyltransferase I [Lysobacteraceae bacterium]|nr:MAG: ribosomal RNA small subunit methyltransferase I [Xanthomonadaceae bacterium]
MASILYVVATPIGNLDDLSERARATLDSVSMIAAEDTRHSGRLLKTINVSTPLLALHDHNEQRATAGLLERLLAGEDVALISDAGTPLISDPGYRLISAAHDAGIEVRAVPGPCAAIAALSIAGLATDKFLFVGFLPAKAAARRKELEGLSGNSATLVFYESGRRIEALMADAEAALGGDRLACVARELTKLHEQAFRGDVAEVRAWLAADPNHLRGEFVVMISGAPNQGRAATIDLDTLLRELAREVPASAAARIAARITGRRKAECYQRLMELIPPK